MVFKSTAFTISSDNYKTELYGLKNIDVPSGIRAYLSKKQSEADSGGWSTFLPISPASYRENNPTKCAFSKIDKNTFVIFDDYGHEFVFTSDTPSFIDYLHKIFKEEKTEAIPELLSCDSTT